jgi:hypothetical protein
MNDSLSTLKFHLQIIQRRRTASHPWYKVMIPLINFTLCSQKESMLVVKPITTLEGSIG